jgi:ABC-2 type transport system ATP-binding protein
VTALSISGLTLRYGDSTVLRDVDLKLVSGEMYALLGSNGTGKSTLLRAACGLLPWAAGNVAICGHDVRQSRKCALARLGYVAQRFSLYDDLTVEENLRFYARCYGLAGEPLSAAIQTALVDFALMDFRDRQSSTLSHGWRQRLAIASATCHRPSVLLLDEATAGLDPEARDGVLTLLAGFAAKGMAIILATHYAEDAAGCMRSGYIRDASLVQALGNT